jgi:hypothetical protein
MASFVRFVFTILLVGMAVNLAVVLLANVQSQRRQARQYEQEAARFKALLADIDGHVRRADVVVESQRVGSDGTPLESTLLIRQYRATGTSQDNPLPVVRITIPGNQLQATGLMLEFDGLFSADVEEYAMLRNTQLVFFGRFCGAGEPAASQPSAADTRFTFMPRDQVPELVRLNPSESQPTPFEIKLWQHLWTLLPEPPAGAKWPWVSPSPSLGLKASWLKPATITVRLRRTYTAYVSADAMISLSEDEPGIPGLLDAMVEEGKKLRSASPE